MRCEQLALNGRLVLAPLLPPPPRRSKGVIPILDMGKETLEKFMMLFDDLLSVSGRC
jgi:hypothetical protein